jgi:hypothetical protein
VEKRDFSLSKRDLVFWGYRFNEQMSN